MMPALEVRFAALLQEHQNILWRVAGLFTQEAHEREDLFQEACLQAWRAFPGFQERCKPSTWLYRIGLNVAISALRQRSRRPCHEPLSDIPAENQSPDDRREILWRALRRLGEGDRAILLLWFDELDYVAIGEVLGLEAALVSVRLVRAKGRLKREVAALEGGRHGRR